MQGKVHWMVEEANEERLCYIQFGAGNHADAAVCAVT
jgi:hypothetical protein